MDTNEQRQESQQNRREERHKRRQRSQIIAYTVVGIMILVLAAGIAFAVSKITSMSRNQEEQQNKVDEILSDEETIQAPTESQETVVELTDEQINEQILAKLRMNGVVNSDPGVVERLDRYMQDKSVVIPVEKKKDGSFSARSGVLSREEMQLISSYVDAKIRSIGREILDGKIAANPYEKGNEEACTYCAYKKVCGFDGSIPGYEKRQLEDLDKQTLMQRMQETVEA